MNGPHHQEDNGDERHTERRPLAQALFERFIWQFIGVTVIITAIVVIAAATR